MVRIVDVLLLMLIVPVLFFAPLTIGSSAGFGIGFAGMLGLFERGPRIRGMAPDRAAGPGRSLANPLWHRGLRLRDKNSVFLLKFPGQTIGRGVVHFENRHL